MPAMPKPQAISSMLAQLQPCSDGYVLEVTRAKMGRDSIVKLEVSDGESQAKAYLDASGVGDSQCVEKLLRGGSSLVVVKEHAVHCYNGAACLEIISFDHVDSAVQEVKMEEDANTKADLLQIGSREENLQREVSPIREGAAVMEVRPVINQREAGRPMEVVNQALLNSQDEQILEEITPEKLSQSDKLTDLYPQFQGEWELIVRLLDKSYREFTSRSGKQIQLLTMQLIDRTATKLEAVMFGEEASDLARRLVVNQVYRMGRGQVKEHAYAHRLAQGYSNLSIVFGRQSQIVRVRDVRAIPKNAQQEVSIRELPSYMDEEKPLDVVGIVIEVHEEKQTVKEDGRVFHRRNIVIGDPQSRKSIDVLLWGREFSISSEMVNKTVHLRNFKLNCYKQVVSLSSSHKSTLNVLPDHPFNKLKPLPNFTSLSNSLKQSNPREQKPPLTTILQLQQSLAYQHDSNEPIASQLEVWISYVNFKSRWFYSACNNPKCKKSAESHARCPHCGSFNAETVKKFNLQVEFSDFTGSLWICAFDEMVGELFRGWRAGEMSGWSEQQRKEEAEKRIYQRQYLLRVVSRKDAEGYVRHGVVGRPAVMEIDETTLRNVTRIKKALY